MDDQPLNLTRLLERASAGDQSADESVIENVYAELKKLAASQLRRESKRDLFQTTALVNEAYLHLFRGQPLRLEDRSHFFKIAARQMRFILVDQARHASHKAEHAPIDELFDLGRFDDATLVAVHVALDDLEKEDRIAAEVVELKVFGGYDNAQTAEILGRSEAQVRRDWTYARAWLFRELSSK